jgi:hypothetical protein
MLVVISMPGKRVLVMLDTAEGDYVIFGDIYPTVCEVMKAICEHTAISISSN